MPMRHALSLALVALLLVGPSIIGPSLAKAAEERPLKVFVLAGTSNMLGRSAKPEDLPDDLQKPLTDVLDYRGGVWTPLEAGKNLVGNEATFGQAMTKHLGEPIGIIWISAASSADKSPAAGINNIVKQSREKGRPIVIAGMLVDVSYRDGNEDRAKAYQENMTRWVEQEPRRAPRQPQAQSAHHWQPEERRVGLREHGRPAVGVVVGGGEGGLDDNGPGGVDEPVPLVPLHGPADVAHHARPLA